MKQLQFGFLIFWFAIGALFAMVASILFPGNIIIQTTVFVISSAILLFATRPFADKITRNDEAVKTNAYSLEGKTGIVTVDIDPENGKGQIKVNGEKWSAKSKSGTYISKDSKITVEKIDGVKAIVKNI